MGLEHEAALCPIATEFVLAHRFREIDRDVPDLDHTRIGNVERVQCPQQRGLARTRRSDDRRRRAARTRERDVLEDLVVPERLAQAIGDDDILDCHFATYLSRRRSMRPWLNDSTRQITQ